MKTGFLKGEPKPLSPALFWRTTPFSETTFFAVNERGELVTALTGGETHGFVKSGTQLYLTIVSTSIVSDWGIDETAEQVGNDTLIYRGVSYVLANNVITPTIEDYQEGEVGH